MEDLVYELVAPNLGPQLFGQTVHGCQTPVVNSFLLACICGPGNHHCEECFLYIRIRTSDTPRNNLCAIVSNMLIQYIQFQIQNLLV